MTTLPFAHTYRFDTLTTLSESGRRTVSDAPTLSALLGTTPTIYGE